MKGRDDSAYESGGSKPKDKSHGDADYDRYIANRNLHAAEITASLFGLLSLLLLAAAQLVDFHMSVKIWVSCAGGTFAVWSFCFGWQVLEWRRQPTDKNAPPAQIIPPELPSKKNATPKMNEPIQNNKISSTNQSGGFTGIIGTLNVGEPERRLSASQAATFAKILETRSSGTVGLELDPNASDSEVFAIDIAQALQAAGIPIAFVNRIMTVGARQVGLTVGGKTEADKALTNEIINAFQKVGIDAKPGRGQIIGDGVNIRLGHAK